MRVLFFGRYDPAYSRNRILLKGLRACGVEVSECRVDPSARLWPLRLFWRYLQASAFDVMVVAFPGQEVMLLARWLTRKPIIFDAFASHYEGYVLDRKTAAPGSMRARWYWWLDRTACRLADAVLSDTNAHADFFASEFSIARGKVHRVFVGTDTDIFKIAGPESVEGFTVHFHGTKIPLQGIPYILQAAVLLKGDDITFNLIGVNRPRMPYEQLGAAMAQAHVCLGIFGDTIKTQRVIPNKVFEALATGRPVITADTPAIRELLDDRSAVLIPTADPRALADAILHVREDPALRARIGQAGRQALLDHATPDMIGRQVRDIMQAL